MKVIHCGFLFWWSMVAVAAPSKETVPCSVKNPSAEEHAEAEAAVTRAKASQGQTAKGAAAGDYTNINIYWHTINAPSSTEFVFRSGAEAQINILNIFLNPDGFKFHLKDYDYTYNASWANVKEDSQEDFDMHNQLRKGNYNDLNIYALDVPRAGEDPFQGSGTFPKSYIPSPGTRNFIFDGVLLAKEVLVNGTAQGRAPGRTAIHEVGHWLNLYHVFDGGDCGGHGDFISDTPSQAYPSYGCPHGKDSCPTYPGYDSIHNHMDYSEDVCRTEFTPEQQTRAHDAFQFLRS